MSAKDMEYAKLCKSMLPKKYSHCPLKKRPVQIYKEDSEFHAQESMDTSEPENLSIKPEDLSVSTLRPASPSSGPTSLVPGSAAQQGHDFFKTSEKERPLGTAFSVPQKETLKTGNRVLEPLNLNTSLGVSHPVAFRPTPQYPPHHYVPHFGYHYGSHDVYQQYQSSIYSVQSVRIHQEHASCLERRDELRSPTGSYPSPVRPLPSLARAPAEKFYLGYPDPDACELSPTSSASSSRSSPPPATPEDLSSPGSVASTESAGSAGMGGGKRRKDSGPRYQCPDCNKSYSTYSGLSKHQQFHCSANEASQAKKSFSCKFCEKVYVSLGALKMHIRTHTLPCKCTVCGKAFSRPWLLQGHVRTHTGEKPFSCQHCGRAFADRSNLRAHLQTHSDVKKYSCTTCSKTFSRMSLLTKHSDGGCPGGNPAPQHECLLYHQQPPHLLPEMAMPDKFHR